MKRKEKHIVIIGGGFAGLNAALILSKSGQKVTLIDKRNFHLFQPLLYQVASGGLSPADIAFPLRAVFKRQNNTNVVLGEVNDINLEQQYVKVGSNQYNYDDLIIATGASTSYFGNHQWADYACGLKTIEDATLVRSRILSAFEKAEIETDSFKKSVLLTFVIIGGGATGVEMAGALAELSRHTLKCDFRNINPSEAKIILIEGAERLLPSYPPYLSKRAEIKLQQLGIEVMTKHFVNNIASTKISLKSDLGETVISAETILWAAGVTASPLGNILTLKYNLLSDISGKIEVQPYCNLPSYNNVFVIGDLAHFKQENGAILPGIAPVAIQQGRYVARYIINRNKGEKMPCFTYHDKGNLAVIGRKSAVAYRGRIQIAGIYAWLIWIFVHLLYLVGFENRILVAVQWAFNYFTYNRSARLITNRMTNCKNQS